MNEMFETGPALDNSSHLRGMTVSPVEQFYPRGNAIQFNTASQAKLLNLFYNLSFKLHKTKANIYFNKKCLFHKIIPKYARINIKTNTPSSHIAVKTAQITWVKSEIRSLYKKKSEINSKLLQLHLQIANNIQTENFLDFYDKLHYDIETEMTKKYKKLDIKINKMLNNRVTTDNKNTQAFFPRVVNLTNTTFSSTETELLNKGLKHNLNNLKIKKNIENLTLDSEIAISLLPPDKQNEARHKTVEIINKIHEKHTYSKEDRLEARTLKDIKKKICDNNLTITKADKGNSIVIMTKNDYVSKTLDFINDNGYILLENDPTKRFLKQVRTSVNNSPSVIQKTQTYKYIPMNPTAPPLNSLPKIHKPNIPIRPVVNYTTAPAYKLSKFLASEISKTIDLEDKFTIKNSIELVDILKNTRITPSHRLLSLDIKNLYTSIPKNDTLSFLKEKLLLNYDRKYVDQIINLTTISLEQNYFEFDCKYYLSKDGLGMGHPTSAILSEIFMQELENVFVPNLIEKFGVIFYCRYVDDSLLILNEDTNINELLNYMNNVHSNITFTSETEDNGKINFLDLTLIRQNNSIEFDIYRKPTNTDITIHSTSLHPSQHKIASFRHMVDRLNRIPLSKTNYDRELQTIYRIAKNNGYQKRTIDKLLEPKQPKEDNNQDNLNRFATFTYIGKNTYLLTNYFKKLGLQISFKTSNNIYRNLRQRSQDQDIYNHSGVYKLTCPDCNNSYIGQTGRTLRDRYKEHIRSFINNKNDSNYANHLLKTGHEPGTINDTMTLLHRGQKGRLLNTLERMEIYKNNALNGRLINEQVHSPSDITFKTLTYKRKRDNDTTQPDRNLRRKLN